MGWSENHLHELPGIKSATKDRFPGCFSCHKCGGELGAKSNVKALVVHYTLPREWRQKDGMGVHRWSVLCHDCEVELTNRAVDGLPFDVAGT
jgi:hypothetical protein